MSVFDERVARFRAHMADKGFDAAVIRNLADLRWLTGAERTFDLEVAHTAFITANDLWLHTDSRYYNTFCERLGEDTPWKLDMEMTAHPEWVAARVQETHARVVAVEDTCDLAFYDAFRSECGKASVACLTPRMHGDISDLRIVKDEEEIETMKKAQAITDAAFAYICDYIKPGMTEMQVRVALENYMFENGADALAFGSIVAAGPNGANPHAQPGEYVIQEGDFVTLDYGAGYHDYKSDMTRTIAVGQPTDEMRKVYDIVLTTHLACAKAAKVGCIGMDIHNLSVKMISDAGYGEYYGHGLGHGVGLEIHERPNFGRLYDKEIPAGSVVTIEPGIYIPGMFGVRIEDYGVMTEAGFEPFTTSPKELIICG